MHWKHKVKVEGLLVGVRGWGEALGSKLEGWGVGVREVEIVEGAWLLVTSG